MVRYPLDCASTMFLLSRSENRRCNIRLTAAIREPVDRYVLQAALARTMQKYPTFFIRFTAQKNRLYFEPVERVPVVRRQESFSELRLMDNPQRCEAQVSFCEKEISLEYFHAVSDGKGGLTILKHLLAEYLSLKYRDDRILSGIPMIPVEKQTENGYHVHGRGFRLERKHGQAYRIQGTPQAEETITVYRFSVRDVKQYARQCHASINELMTAILFRAIARVQRDEHENQKKLRLTVPIDLRIRFPSQTLRNFTLNAYLEWKPQTERMELPALCAQIRRYMQRAAAPEQLAGRCASSALASELWPVSVAPLAIKRWIVRKSLNNPKAASCMTFSNLGVVELPTELKDAVEELRITFSAKPEAPYSACLVSVKDRMCLSLLRTIMEPLLEVQLEETLLELGIDFEKNGA